MSLSGVALGFVFYLLSAAMGITALVVAVPYAYDALRFTGAIYLGYLAWNTLKPGAAPVFKLRALSPDRPEKLFVMGFVTSLLNPKVAVLYLSLLPQFIDPALGHILLQSLIFGTLQIAISVGVNALIVLSAGSVALFLGGRPLWARIQRWLMGTVLAGLAAKLALESQR